MRVIALVLEYDGGGYCGFQRQAEGPTIAGEVETALAALVAHPVRLVAAGRTDAGVHATGQVVSFETESGFELRRFPVALSALLRKRSIAVVRAAERPAGFSARFDAQARTYRYRILNRNAPSPLEERRAYHVSLSLNPEPMREALALLRGRHDFAGFTTAEQQGSTTRCVLEASIDRDPDHLTIEITADSFLHRMVRIVSGTLVRVGRGELSVGDVRSLLSSKTRGSAMLTAPAHGLYLTHVRYADPI